MREIYTNETNNKRASKIFDDDNDNDGNANERGRLMRDADTNKRWQWFTVVLAWATWVRAKERQNHQA